jgi:protein SCO1/2
MVNDFRLNEFGVSQAMELALQDQQQKKHIKWTVIALSAFISLVLGLTVNKIQRQQAYTQMQEKNQLVPDALRNQLREQGLVVLSKPRSIQAFDLMDQHKKHVELADFNQHWTLLFFGFTRCPDICPTTLAFLKRVNEQLKQQNTELTLSGEQVKPIKVVLVSVDPGRDSPEVLSAYLSYFDPEFRAFTGEFMALQGFAEQLNAAFIKVTQGDTYVIDHSSHISLINPDGEFQAYFKAPFKRDEFVSGLQALRRHWR